MTTPRTVAVLIGSLRKASFNRKMANAVIAMAPGSLKFNIIEIGDLPPFNQDWENEPPKVVSDFKAAIEASDAVLFVTPEYNRSVPGLLKNAIDIGSRPYGKNSWTGRPTAVISVSPGAIGGFGANHHLRQMFVSQSVPVLPHEAYIGNAASLFDDSGKLINDGTRDFIGKFLAAFEQWIASNAKR